MRDLRYGENPHQKPAALYATDLDDPLALHRFEVIEGEPGYVNWTDVDRSLTTLNQIAAAWEHNFHIRPCVAVGVKHGNACGAAVADTDVLAITHMIEGQPQDLFGGVVMTNFPITDTCAEKLTHHKTPSESRRILDVIVAPEITNEAVVVLHRNKDRCKMLVNPALASVGKSTLRSGMIYRQVRGGLLKQPASEFMMDFKHPELDRRGFITSSEEQALLLGWAVGSTSNSNTIVLSAGFKGGCELLANAVGQQSRVGGARLAVDRARKAGRKLSRFRQYRISALSDSFFPFPDGPEVLMKAGVKSILATSGSLNDNNVVAFCERHDIALYRIPDKVARGFFGH